MRPVVNSTSDSDRQRQTQPSLLHRGLSGGQEWRNSREAKETSPLHRIAAAEQLLRYSLVGEVICNHWQQLGQPHHSTQCNREEPKCFGSEATFCLRCCAVGVSGLVFAHGAFARAVMRLPCQKLVKSGGG
mmetsp:Transcript_41457/g.79430  ORF Transcript_41457/g.79430 Transcript_41457/m.79430 type:complete len:131 (-) Transcript_41457:641-1033(-)